MKQGTIKFNSKAVCFNIYFDHEYETGIILQKMCILV